MKTNTTVSSDLAAEKVESENLIDLTYLNDFADGDADFIEQMVHIFIQNSPIKKIILEANQADDIQNLKVKCIN
jgi:hypothetical protein